MAAIFFDIDGTIWDYKNVMPESTVLAVKKLKENGHLTFLCSGRMCAMIRDPRLAALSMDGMIAGCGTYAEFRGEELFNNEMEPELLKRTVQQLQAAGFGVVVEGKEKIFADKTIRSSRFGRFIERGAGDALVPMEEAAGSLSGTKFTILLCGQEEEAAAAQFSEDFEVIFHGGFVMELVPKGNNKATGIAQVCEALCIPHEETYAIGDSDNDIDMLRYAAHGIAMGNATPGAKAAADFVTADIHEDGLYQAFAYYGLIG